MIRVILGRRTDPLHLVGSVGRDANTVVDHSPGPAPPCGRRARRASVVIPFTASTHILLRFWPRPTEFYSDGGDEYRITDILLEVDDAR